MTVFTFTGLKVIAYKNDEVAKCGNTETVSDRKAHSKALPFILVLIVQGRAKIGLERAQWFVRFICIETDFSH